MVGVYVECNGCLLTVVEELGGIEQLEAKQLLMKLSCDDFSNPMTDEAICHWLAGQVDQALGKRSVRD